MAKIKKELAAGVASKKVKAPMVDPNGAYTKVQERTLGNMKKGGKVPKGMHKMPDGSLMKNSEMKAKDGKWIQKAIKKPGALRKQLGAKPGKPIPAGKLAAAAKKPGKLGQRARLAQTLKKMKK